jgi:hypothetical protein
MEEYKNKINNDLISWMDEDVPKIVPIGTRKKLLKRKFPRRLEFIIEKYERRLTINQVKELRELTTNQFNLIINNLI